MRRHAEGEDQAAQAASQSEAAGQDLQLAGLQQRMHDLQAQEQRLQVRKNSALTSILSRPQPTKHELTIAIPVHHPALKRCWADTAHQHPMQVLIITIGCVLQGALETMQQAIQASSEPQPTLANTVHEEVLQQPAAAAVAQDLPPDDDAADEGLANGLVETERDRLIRLVRLQIQSMLFLKPSRGVTVLVQCCSMHSDDNDVASTCTCEQLLR